jgi:hypothetical protein
VPYLFDPTIVARIHFSARSAARTKARRAPFSAARKDLETASLRAKSATL